MEHGVEQGNCAARRHFSVDKVRMCYWQKQHDKLLTLNQARRAWPWKVQLETVAVCKLRMCIFASKLSYVIFCHFHLTFKFILFRKSSCKFTLHIAPPNFALVFHGKKKSVFIMWVNMLFAMWHVTDHVQNTGHDIVWHLKFHLCSYTLILLGLM